MARASGGAGRSLPKRLIRFFCAAIIFLLNRSFPPHFKPARRAMLAWAVRQKEGFVIGAQAGIKKNRCARAEERFFHSLVWCNERGFTKSRACHPERSEGSRHFLAMKCRDASLRSASHDPDQIRRLLQF